VTERTGNILSAALGVSLLAWVLMRPIKEPAPTAGVWELQRQKQRQKFLKQRGLAGVSRRRRSSGRSRGQQRR